MSSRAKSGRLRHAATIRASWARLLSIPGGWLEGWFRFTVGPPWQRGPGPRCQPGRPPAGSARRRRSRQDRGRFVCQTVRRKIRHRKPLRHRCLRNGRGGTSPPTPRGTRPVPDRCDLGWSQRVLSGPVEPAVSPAKTAISGSSVRLRGGALNIRFPPPPIRRSCDVT